MIAVRNLFAELPGSAPGEVCDTLLEKDGLRIERIVSHSSASPEGFWYDQEQEEWILVLKGEAKLRIFQDELILLKAGDYLLIPRRRRHRVEWTSVETIWLAIHVLPRRGEAGGEGTGENDADRRGA